MEESDNDLDLTPVAKPKSSMQCCAATFLTLSNSVFAMVEATDTNALKSDGKDKSMGSPPRKARRGVYK
jgi:hypothetical protein